MNEEIFEKLAQIQHENLKLLDELNHLKEHTLSIEETLNLKCSESLKQKKHIKSLEQHINNSSQMIKDKDHLIDSLEHEKKSLKQLHTKLSSENLLLKGELLQEKLRNKQMEILKAKEEELKNAYAKVKEENQKLISELSLKSSECFSNSATIESLLLQVKELENEKSELMTMRDTLLIQNKEEQLKSLENLEYSLRKSPEWSKFQRNPFTQDEQDLISSISNREMVNLNLREEILEVELREMQKKIGHFESLLRKKEEEEMKKNKLITELKQLMIDTGLLNYNSKNDLNLDSLTLYNIYNYLLQIINWPESQSGECKPLTDVAALSIVVKDGVQTSQPSSLRIIETMSIASQTDPIKNLSPVLPFKAFEKLHSKFSVNRSLSDSEDDGEESLSGIRKSSHDKTFQLFAEPKNCDLDMDIYRSCRKLSVLPEEDIDESLNRKYSFKKPYGFRYSRNSKTQSADDITKIKTIRPSLKPISSFSNITYKNCKLTDVSGSFWEKHRSCDINVDNSTTEDAKTDDKMNNRLKLPNMSSRDAFRQPHSFDSYLDPLKTRNSPLPRQISDPTQNTVSAPSIIRRGSYFKRPKSTCRPLTLPCDKKDRNKEERVCKVRFDLPGIASKQDDKVTKKEFSSSVLNSAKKIKTVSRFRVEIIDEEEFKKYLEENPESTFNRKRPPLIHSGVYPKSALRDLTNFGEKNEVMCSDMTEFNKLPTEVSDGAVYDTTTEYSRTESFDFDDFENNYVMNDSSSLKRRRQSDVSCYSLEDSQDSSEGSSILTKSIKLHTNSDCIVMKELRNDSSGSSCSIADSETPYIDAEDIPAAAVLHTVKVSPVSEILFTEKHLPRTAICSPGSFSENSDAYFTPCDVSPVSENNEASSTAGFLKSSGLSKSPTVLKNLANFELLAAISESRKLMQSKIIEDLREEHRDLKFSEDTEQKKFPDETAVKAEGFNLNRTSCDLSEASESDTLTYCTVKSHTAASSDCDSDTYVTVWSDKSFTLERKFSDLSENSSSPYNTPPDTSSASFCTPPDTYSPILNSVKKHSGGAAEKLQRNSDAVYPENKPDFSNNHNGLFNGCHAKCSKLSERRTNAAHSVIFDSPKLEFYETNDSVENLKAFLQAEEGLTESEPKAEHKNEKPDESENVSESMTFETEELKEAFSKRVSLESPKLLERRGKKHPLSRQNSTEEYNFLDPHDSCLNLSEEFSSPSTTPDTSNKTVVFKNAPLTVSSTIDLDDDFPISETENQTIFHDSKAGISEVPLKSELNFRYTQDGHCLSEPCTPSISAADFAAFSVPRKQRSSFTEESLMQGKSEASVPQIVVSGLASESENSGAPGCAAAAAADTDFASNISDRSEVNLSDVTSIFMQSDNSDSLSEHSEHVMSDQLGSDSEKSSSMFLEITRYSSSPPASDKTPSGEFQNSAQEEHLSDGSDGSEVLNEGDLPTSNSLSEDDSESILDISYV